MREFSTPLTGTLPDSGSLTDDLLRWADTEPERPLVSRRTPQGWSDVSAAELLAEVRALAKGLLAAGVQPGDRLGLMSRTRLEWALLDYAIWYVGAVGVPLYPSSTPEQVAWILANSGATGLFVEDQALADRAAEVADQSSEPIQVWVIEGSGLTDLVALGTDVEDESLEQRRGTVDLDSPATLVYTSGTTGPPKGCVLTHRNLTVELAVALPELAELFEDPDACTLLFLPLAHVFARVIQVGAVRAGTRLGHCSGLAELNRDLTTFRPTFLLAVPRVFEKLFTAASQEAAADGRGRLFDRATEAAISFSQSLDRGRVGPLARARHAVFDRTVYTRIRQALGGRCRFVVSGGAPLGERLGHFYRGIGITVLEGYGLTETTAALTTNVPGAFRIGSVGRPLPGTSLRLSEDGELLVRGGQVFDGYWHNDRATAAVLDEDGWFRTGDLAEIDGEGFVRILGRREEVLVTTGGKNVSPGPLEDRLRAHPLIAQAVVVGDGQPYVAAVVTLEPEPARAWAHERGKGGSLATLATDPQLVAEIQQAVDDANRPVSRAEAIRRFIVVATQWTEEGGQLTPSLKVRRNVVLSQHAADVERLFED